MKARDNIQRRHQVTERALHLWREAGSPPAGPDAYRDLASELIAIEESQLTTLHRATEPGPYGEPVEPVLPNENLGEFPTTTDEGEQTYPPKASGAASG
jgi:hypothetical protein